jgi:hypothetical protein
MHAAIIPAFGAVPVQAGAQHPCPPEQALFIAQTAVAARNPDAIAPRPNQNPVAGHVTIRTA